MFPKETKFLVIDDFATMRKIIKKVLSELGYTNVTEADDGATGWPLIQQAHASNEPFQFVISDWNMPQMQGIDLLKHCRADARFKALPFMLVTAESEQKQILEAAKAGVSNYVVKPFNSVTLKQKLEQVYAKVSTSTAKAA